MYVPAVNFYLSHPGPAWDVPLRVIKPRAEFRKLDTRSLLDKQKTDFILLFKYRLIASSHILATEYLGIREYTIKLVHETVN